MEDESYIKLYKNFYCQAVGHKQNRDDSSWHEVSSIVTLLGEITPHAMPHLSDAHQVEEWPTHQPLVVLSLLFFASTINKG